MLDDDPVPPEDEFVDFAAYSEVTSTGLSRPPCDVCEPTLWTLEHDTIRHLNGWPPAAYDEYMHIVCIAVLDSFTNAAIGEVFWTRCRLDMLPQRGKR
jgi:hypothetical protein